MLRLGASNCPATARSPAELDPGPVCHPCGKRVGRGAKTPVSMRDYGRASVLIRRGSLDFQSPNSQAPLTNSPPYVFLFPRATHQLGVQDKVLDERRERD